MRSRLWISFLSVTKQYRNGFWAISLKNVRRRARLNELQPLCILRRLFKERVHGVSQGTIPDGQMGISLETSCIFIFFKKLCSCKITTVIKARKVILKSWICYYDEERHIMVNHHVFYQDAWKLLVSKMRWLHFSTWQAAREFPS